MAAKLSRESTCTHISHPRIERRLQSTLLSAATKLLFVSAFDFLCQESGIVCGGFTKAGILEALSEAEAEAEDCGSESDP